MAILPDCLLHVGRHPSHPRSDLDAIDGFRGPRDLDFTRRLRAIRMVGDEGDLVAGGGKDTPPNPEQPVQLPDREIEAPRDPGERGDE